MDTHLIVVLILGVTGGLATPPTVRYVFTFIARMNNSSSTIARSFSLIFLGTILSGLAVGIIVLGLPYLLGLIPLLGMAPLYGLSFLVGGVLSKVIFFRSRNVT